MEEMHGARYGERVRSVQALSQHSILPRSPRVHQPGSSLEPPPSGFLKLHYIDMID